MNEVKSVPLVTVALYALWAWTLLTLIICWVMFAGGHINIGRSLGFTACVSSAVAVAVTNRWCTSRVCRLMRVLNSSESPRGPELHRVP